jgi:hypothetical protein
MLSHSCPAGRRWNGYGRVGRGAGAEQGQDRGRVLFRGEPRITLLSDVTDVTSGWLIIICDVSRFHDFVSWMALRTFPCSDYAIFSRKLLTQYCPSLGLN